MNGESTGSKPWKPRNSLARIIKPSKAEKYQHYEFFYRNLFDIDI